MLFNRTLFLQSKTRVYNEFVRIIGKRITDWMRYFFITPLKIFINRKPLKDLKEVLTYYRDSSMKNFTPRELINEYLFSLMLLPKQRLHILSFQYKFLYQRLTAQKRYLMTKGGITCWGQDYENCSHHIVLRITQKYESEGCLSLIYSFDGKDIYLIAFTICPGIDFGFPDQAVILISRIQGIKGKHEDISKASKQLLDIFPASALMSALEGLCLSLDIHKIIGISAVNQVSFIGGKDLEHAKIQYDEFWQTYESSPVDKSGDYLIRIPYLLKSTTLIRSKFRKRTLAKRHMKSDISKIIQTNCHRLFSSFNALEI